ncbi:hypothetical protein [Methylobacterium brachiatum]|uniref:hypothetical protein n=1 Tax=Methylobacterium brachiatum TaxID=269660 RepID=UPI002449CA5F|nr:hypothetical protein [Methylobacterium brachiatum]MDH2313367.1 hypothetical protein [Methylobacterium brachiatum]
MTGSPLSRLGASDLDQSARRNALNGTRSPGMGRESPGAPSPRDPAVASVEAAASVAVSCLEPIVIADAHRLMHLGCACRRAAATFAIEASRLASEIVRGDRADCPAPEETAQRAFDLEASAQTLQGLSQDAELLALLRHRARFADLVRIAEAMDRGLTFVPVEPVTADRLAAPAAVVVFSQDNAASLRGRVGRGLARLKRRA